jgi:hypothetical protein
VSKLSLFASGHSRDTRRGTGRRMEDHVDVSEDCNISAEMVITMEVVDSNGTVKVVIWTHAAVCGDNVYGNSY